MDIKTVFDSVESGVKVAAIIIGASWTYWKFVIPKFEGEIPTKLRIELQYIDALHPKEDKVIYSNIIDGTINPGQLWNKEKYYPQGIMDPYND